MSEEVKKNTEAVKEAIKVIIEAGADVSYKNVRVYKSSGGGDKPNNYRILVFDLQNMNVQNDKEENYDIVDDAVAKFVKLTKGAL